MNKTLRAVFIIPYFGQIPDYFHLWLKSAEANPDFTFFIYTDLDFPVSLRSNVKIKHITFGEIQKKIKKKLGEDCKLNTPYKLCDYKPAYGYLFAEDITAFDFWGFCDLDLIFGNIGKIITQDVLRNNDKIFMHGHFCLMRNSKKFRLLFLKKFPTVLDFDCTKSTNYACHFDENGTISYAPDFDNEIRYSFPGYFYDVPVWDYCMTFDGSEACAFWENGTLTQYWNNAKSHREILYIHLQKRKMIRIPQQVDNRLVIYRNNFLDNTTLSPSSILTLPLEIEEKLDFSRQQKKIRCQQILRNILTGALKFRFFKCTNHWQMK